MTDLHVFDTPWQVTDLGKTFVNVGEGNWLSHDGISDGFWWAHTDAAGKVCGMGQVKFPPWELESEDPVTIKGSLKCLNCGRHGFVSGGKWVEV